MPRRNEERPRCAQCGAKLRPFNISYSGATRLDAIGKVPNGREIVDLVCNRLSSTRPFEAVVLLGYGYSGNDHFCTLRCGFQYGLGAIAASKLSSGD